MVRELTCVTRLPVARPCRPSSAPWKDGSAPKIRVPVSWSAVAMPERRPPPPKGAITASRRPGGRLGERSGLVTLLL